MLPQLQQQLAHDQQDLANANHDLANAQSVLNHDNSKLNSLKNKLNQDKQQLQHDVDVLNGLQNKLNDIKNTPKKLHDAQNSLSDAQHVLDHANHVLSNAQATLANDETILNHKRQVLAQAFHTLNVAHNAIAQSNAQASHAMNSSEIGNYYTLRSNAATTLDNQSALNDVVPFVNNDVKADTVTSAEGESKEVSSLPQTGETNDKATKEGAIALGFASILAGLGFGYKRRH